MNTKTHLMAGASLAATMLGSDPSLLGCVPGRPRIALEAPNDQGTAEAKPVTVKDLAEVQTSLKTLGDSVKNFAEDLSAKVKAGVDKSDASMKDLTEKADKALNEQGELRARLLDLEQRVTMTPKPGGDDDQAQSPGQRFIADDRVKKFCADRSSRGRVRVDMAAVTTTSVGASLTQPQRLQGFIPLPERRFTIRDLLTPGRTGQNAVQYVKESGFTNMADTVTEATTKPESTVAFTLETKSVATIAHWILASK